MELGRREFLTLGGAAVLGGLAGATAACQRAPAGNADYTLRIGTGLVDLGADRIVSTTLYNGQFPGPLLRFTEGTPVIVDVHNDTDTPEQVHWHGQTLPVDVDGSAEEGTPFIPAHGMRRLRFVPGPAGLRFYHTHLVAGADLSLGAYSGQAGPVYIEPKRHPGAYDQEVFLTLKEFAPTLNRSGDMGTDYLAGPQDPRLRDTGEAALAHARARGLPLGFDLDYGVGAVNGRALGHGDPIRVKPGDRVLLQVLNASATETRSLALPGHTFTVVALDGNPVPKPAPVPVLWLGAAERVTALVEMTTPGVWVLGDTDDEDRANGMGIVVEYAGATGPPQWAPPPPFRWDYRLFAPSATTPSPPDQVIDMLFERQDAADHGFDVWTINGQRFAMQSGRPRFAVDHGKRYRLRLRNASDSNHPIHLHRHTFEITHIAGTPTAASARTS
ncbi:Multicopper oxidase MmcO [Mycobacterium talmoniae]|uniref:Multicopper oxidase MmcO n=1 Tax=Mycobacterium talmoniae TaxID=1858794 RepID=A0A2S8BP66_9MYCO|nr:Multicopper oxidase MmcO [Mycobacterium talmoniae]